MLTGAGATKEKLMRAALQLVAVEGFAAATTAALAEAAGVAEGTLYRHFASKDDLLIETYRALKTDMARAAKTAAEGQGPIDRRLTRFWRAVFDAYRADPDAFRFAQRFVQTELAKREGGEASQGFIAHLASLMEEGVAQGALKPVAADLFITAFLASCSAMVKQAVDGRVWSEAELEAAAAAAVAGWRA